MSDSTKTVQGHYDRLNGEFTAGVGVNMLSTDHVELDLGDRHPVDTLDTVVDQAVETLEALGYTPTGTPTIEAGYRGAHNEALLVQIPISEDPYNQPPESLSTSSNE